MFANNNGQPPARQKIDELEHRRFDCRVSAAILAAAGSFCFLILLAYLFAVATNQQEASPLVALMLGSPTAAYLFMAAWIKKQTRRISAEIENLKLKEEQP